MTDVKSIYQEALQNTHAAEKQGLTQMEAQVDGLAAYPEYKALVQQHITTTKEQLARLDQAISEAGTSTGTLREAVTAAAGAVGTAVHAVMPDKTLKNLFAGYAFQHEQVAAYMSLAVIAKAAGFEARAGEFEGTAKEEAEAAKKVEAVIGSVTEKFLAEAAK